MTPLKIPAAFAAQVLQDLKPLARAGRVHVAGGPICATIISYHQ